MYSRLLTAFFTLLLSHTLVAQVFPPENLTGPEIDDDGSFSITWQTPPNPIFDKPYDFEEYRISLSKLSVGVIGEYTARYQDTSYSFSNLEDGIYTVRVKICWVEYITDDRERVRCGAAPPVEVLVQSGPPLVPAVSAYFSPVSVVSGDYARLHWSSTHVTRCSGIPDDPTTVPNGSKNYRILRTTDWTVTVTCIGPAGSAVGTAMLRVTVPDQTFTFQWQGQDQGPFFDTDGVFDLYAELSNGGYLVVYQTNPDGSTTLTERRGNPRTVSVTGPGTYSFQSKKCRTVYIGDDREKEVCEELSTKISVTVGASVQPVLFAPDSHNLLIGDINSDGLDDIYLQAKTADNSSYLINSVDAAEPYFLAPVLRLDPVDTTGISLRNVPYSVLDYNGDTYNDLRVEFTDSVYGAAVEVVVAGGGSIRVFCYKNSVLTPATISQCRHRQRRWQLQHLMSLQTMMSGRQI
ncbi:fibronectin type III domain-containing protein [Exilibacterium tricleocarpae]|uniref:Fibronectin type III domain-containing protein n=1 Tax=Exilibacterium tricleocarpae TaxID=2591008 RepID=A0A545TYZ5_9GAMM|nr:fibronectin type III domain-containing protein [Exilibacterium tricleocarpae]TQV82431.1 fibronectin type III domain-containing protein [Exilibacterium tricleocarpae]